MTTTIQVDEETLEILRQLKDSYNYKSYDEVIKGMLQKNKMKSMHGIFSPKSKKWIMKDLRDETDRF